MWTEHSKNFFKQDKQFQYFAENETGTSKLQQIIKYQMNKLFQELNHRFNDFSIDGQTKFIAQVNEYIQSLPEEKQSKIKEKLGIDDLTDEVIRKVMVTSGVSFLFAGIVEVSGFAFYTAATSLLASAASLLNITLSFGVYTKLTSTIAILSNPMFFIPLLLGGGALLVNFENKSLKKKLLPIIIMQITLPYMSGKTEEASFERFIQEWNRRYGEYCRSL